MKKLFGNTKITWKFLILFSIILGIGVGILNRIPFLKDTSFQDIAIVLDMWIILAIFMIINCKNVKEAIIKCFIFFLISQPLIYLTEVIIDCLFNNMNFIDRFTLYFKNYYIGAGWLYWTILTIPGAFIAYNIKKDNILSAIILSVATGYLSFVGTNGLINCILNHFPYHLINSLICLSMAFILIFVILNNKKSRIISIIINIIAIILSIILFTKSLNKPINASDEITLDCNILDYKVNDENIATALLDENDKTLHIYSSINTGITHITIKCDNNKYIYEVNSSSKSFDINLRKTE